MGSLGTSPAQSSSGISIDFTQDLESVSDLKSLLSANGSAILQLGKTLDQYAGKAVSEAVGASLGPLTFTATLPSWTAGPVTFSLTPTATCTITIAAKAEDFEVATKIDDTSTTIAVQPAPAGMTFVNIDLDFTLTGSASGSGAAYGVTIAGSASGSAATTLSFCQPVPSATLTLDALKLAFSQIVFPTGTGSLGRMQPGSSSRMNFDGSLNLSVSASYGLGPYMLSAASPSSVVSGIQAIQKAVPVTITAPTAQISVGATASVTYAHTDHFGLVIEKPDANTALLYLIRSGENDFSESAGITVSVETSAASVALNPAQIQQTVQTVTGSATLASEVGTLVSAPVNNVATAALAKLNTWIADANGTTGLSLTLAQQKGRTALFNYSVTLTQPAVAQSWDSLLSHNLTDPNNIPGFTLLPGSGVAEQLTRSTTLQFNFFNLYMYTSVTDFFDKTTSELAPDGTIRISYDIGVEELISSNSAGDTMRFHFTGTATEDVLANVSKAEIDLNVEISEHGDPKGAAVLANLLGMLNQASLQSTITAMGTYAKSNPGGTLGLVAVLKQSAYGKLLFSPFTGGLGGKPQASQPQDRSNWDMIYDATLTLMPNMDSMLMPFTYDDWANFNSICNTGKAGAIPNRRSNGNSGAVPPSFWQNSDQASLIGLFFTESARGMNLFEDLPTLANDLTSVVTDAQWKLIQGDVVTIVKTDFNSDYSKPIAAAILQQATAQSGAQIAVSTAEAKDSSTFTTTITIA